MRKNWSIFVLFSVFKIIMHSYMFKILRNNNEHIIVNFFCLHILEKFADAHTRTLTMPWTYRVVLKGNKAFLFNSSLWHSTELDPKSWGLELFWSSMAYIMTFQIRFFFCFEFRMILALPQNHTRHGLLTSKVLTPLTLEYQPRLIKTINNDKE